MSTLISLTKSLNISLEKANIIKIPEMQVKLLVDKSGSMSSMFYTGWVQDTIDLFLVAALKFDDDGKLQIGFFNSSFKQLPDVVEADAGKYIVKNGVRADGGTCFAEGIAAFKGGTREKKGFFGSMFSKAETLSTTPTYIAMITDGQCTDERQFEAQLKDLDGTFIQIIGIGHGVDKRYLDSVASQHANVSVIYLDNPTSVTQDSFYDMILNKDLKQFIGA